MPDTPFCAATFNVRRATLTELYPSRRWSARKPVCQAFLRKVRDAAEARGLPLGVIGLQEATQTQVNDLESALGSNWTRVEYDLNVNLLVNGLLFDIVGDRIRLDMPSGSRQRHAVFAFLKSRATNDTALFGSTHLAAKTITEPYPERYRPAQMRMIGAKIVDLGKAYGRPIEVILFGDFNDNSLNGGVRKIARESYGLAAIQHELVDREIKGETYKCHHAWGRPSDTETSTSITWICDALTKSVTLDRAMVYRTSTEVYPKVQPSDHNLILIEGKY